MAAGDTPVEALRKVIRDANQLHRRLATIADVDDLKVRLIGFKGAAVARYEALGGTWPESPHSLAGPKHLPVEQGNAGSNPAAGTTC